MQKAKEVAKRSVGAAMDKVSPPPSPRRGSHIYILIKNVDLVMTAFQVPPWRDLGRPLLRKLHIPFPQRVHMLKSQNDICGGHYIFLTVRRDPFDIDRSFFRRTAMI